MEDERTERMKEEAEQLDVFFPPPLLSASILFLSFSFSILLSPFISFCRRFLSFLSILRSCVLSLVSVSRLRVYKLRGFSVSVKPGDPPTQLLDQSVNGVKAQSEEEMSESKNREMCCGPR